MKEIVIPKYRKKKKTPHSSEYYHYEFLYTTKNLAVYKCIETGFIESFQKNDFIGKNEYKERKGVT